MDVVIVAAARTPIGSFNGAFAAVPAHQLGEAAIRAALSRAKLEPGAVDEVILGQVLTANQGQNPARQAARAAGVPDDKIAFGINQVCGSGCARWRWRPSRSAPARATSSSPADRRA